MSPPARPEGIAIVGAAGIFPGAADIQSLGELSARRGSAIRPAPSGRWSVPRADVIGVGPDRAFSDLGGYLDELPGPDDVDPVHRLLREVAGAALADRGDLPRRRTGLVLASIALPTDAASAAARVLHGAAFDAALGLPRRALPHDPAELRAFSLPAERLAAHLGLGGGAVAVDAACASSLHALHVACEELRAGRADAMIAGGVSRPDCLYTQIGFSQLGALSRRGRCAPFDAAADGLLVGEGAALFVLRRLGDAIAGGERILAVIRGVGLSNDMGGSLLSPESEGQLRAMHSAYASAGLAPAEIDWIECHGTGTPRGDAVELASLAELLRGTPAPPVISSIKGNIGHLLTGAGAAGLARVLAALDREELPPATVETPAPALRAAPVRTLERPVPWERRAPGVPRRAAISAFGFGGGNAHLIVEEHLGGGRRHAGGPRGIAPPCAPVAIVGMAAHVGRLADLDAFRQAALSGEPALEPRPAGRFAWLEQTRTFRERTDLRALPGAWIETVDVPVGRFRIPPREIEALLPQHLLALEVACDAVHDAGGLGDAPRPRTGVVVGAELDPATTSFHLRWEVEEKARALGADGAWTRAARDALAPPLDASRTLGALGGVLASRISRELAAGGPVCSVGAGELSGLRALELAVRALQRGEADAMVVAAVDVADVRRILADDAVRPFAREGACLPFDRRSAGALPGEGAVALVLRPLEQAQRAGDRVHAVIRGVGVASGDGAYATALRRAWDDAGADPASAGLIEAHGSGHAAEDAAEADALLALLGPGEPSCALAAAPAVTGQCGAAGSLIAVLRAALALSFQVLPATPRLREPIPARWERGRLFFPGSPEPWLRDRAGGPRRAGASAMGASGMAGHVVLEGVESPVAPARAIERTVALFLVRDDGAALREELDRGGTPEAMAVRHHRRGGHGAVSRAIVAASVGELRAALEAPASPRPVPGDLAFVFPGSGAQTPGMLRELAACFPAVLHAHDAEVSHLSAQLAPAITWARGVREPEDARARIAEATAPMIAAQAAASVAYADALVRLGVKPAAVLGHSLGESAALLFTRAWRDRDELLRRLLESPLFTTELAGPREVARRTWGEGDWLAAMIARPAAAVRTALTGTAALLAVNAPEECLVGGRRADVLTTASRLAAEPIPVPGLATVHHPLVRAVEGAYRALHELPVAPVAVRFHLAAAPDPFVPDGASVAEAITRAAIEGIDFVGLVERAYAAGARIFVEPGPGASCTRWIGRILAGREHLAVSAGGGWRSFLEALGRLAEAGVPVDLDPVYGAAAIEVVERRPPEHVVRVPLGGPSPLPPPVVRIGDRAPAATGGVFPRTPVAAPAPAPRAATALAAVSPWLAGTALAAAIASSARATAAAHESFLALAARGMALQANAIELQRAVAARAGAVARHGAAPARANLALDVPALALDVPALSGAAPPRAFDRAACLEFATGSIAAVLGPAWAPADAFPTRVRLPDEPLMLVDRILAVEGTPGVLGRSRIVTEHDVLPGAWYLDGGRAPTAFSIEAGQADLFLSAFLGIDLLTRGERRYRLLDAKVTFHRDLPRPGETVRYDIRIDRFLRQGDTHLFFFEFDGAIGGEKLVTMRDGCAGFFSGSQLASGQGIVGGPALPAIGTPRGEPFEPPVPVPPSQLDDVQLDALRRGDAGAAFGDAFAGVTLPPGLRLPGDRLRLVHRVRELDPAGGRHGRGTILGEADVDPEAWFLTRHFRDDPVMPGTLMYECCAHTLRVLLLRLGLVAEGDLHVAPVPGLPARLRCRGQVTPSTRRVQYRVDVREIGWDPAPYAIADASMIADGQHVVEMEGMSLRLAGLDRDRVERFWTARSPFDRGHVDTFATGRPSAAFGARYAPFDGGRYLARLPARPYSFVDRVAAFGTPGLAPGARVRAEHHAQGDLPPALLIECGLQACGWLAAERGAALEREDDLVFRALEVKGRVLGPAGPGLLSTHGRIDAVSRAGGAIVLGVSWRSEGPRGPAYEGTATLGFFPRTAPAPSGLREDPPPPAGGGWRAHPPGALDILERVSVGEHAAEGTLQVNPDAWWFAAHFKDDPVLPATLGLVAARRLCEIFAADRLGPCRLVPEGEHHLVLRGAVTPATGRLRVHVAIDRQDGRLVARGRVEADGTVIHALEGLAFRVAKER